MKAAQITEYGDSSVVKIKKVDIPEIKEGQVLVEVHAASLNPFDTSVRSGSMKDVMPVSFPATLGGDFAGIVAEVADGVTSVAAGDKVYGQANVVGGSSGAFAEFAATSAGQVAKISTGLSFTDAASLPLVGVSALQALTRHIGLQSNQKLFIHGGAGGIGTIAIQIAKSLGAFVATTATGDNIGYVKSLGADQIIDYNSEDFTQQLHDFDAVFDTVGGKDFVKSYRILKPGGTAVTMIGTIDEAAGKKYGITAVRQGTQVTTEQLDALSKLVESGAVTAHVDRVFPLDEIKNAFKVRESGAIRGKVVLTIP